MANSEPGSSVSPTIALPVFRSAAWSVLTIDLPVVADPQLTGVGVV